MQFHVEKFEQKSESKTVNKWKWNLQLIFITRRDCQMNGDIEAGMQIHEEKFE